MQREETEAIPTTNGMDRGGMLIREIPVGILDNQIQVLPMFALYTANPATQKMPLKEMLALSGLPVEEFLRARLLAPFADLWMELALHGIVVEADSKIYAAALNEFFNTISGA